MLQDFLRAARSAGLRISPAESIDAVRAVQLVGLAERERLRDTLGLVLAKTVDEKRRYEACFDRFFSRDGFRNEAPVDMAAVAGDGTGSVAGDGTGSVAGDGTGSVPGDGTGSGGGLGRLLLEGDEAGLAAAAERAAAEVGVADIRLFTQVNLFTLRILERMGLEALERAIAADGPQAATLRQGRDRLRGEVRGLVRRNLELFAAGDAEALREDRLRRTRLAAIDRRDHERMRVLVRAMARRLATLYGRRRMRDRRGVLDARRTLRRNMGWGGVPFVAVWRRRRIDKPKLVVLCDVSGSVAALAQFLLLFVHSLSEALSGLRSFAFSGELVEVGDLLERLPIEAAIPAVMDRIGFGSSNYGRALADFERGWMGVLDSRTTIIVLGDARGNGNDPRTEILRRMADRAKQVIWLNPEVRTVWGTGDSDMLRYAPHCRVSAVCNTAAQLERVIGGLLRDGG